MRASSRRRVAVAVTLLCCLWTMTPPATAGAVGAAGGGSAADLGVAQTAPDDPCVGTVDEPADGMTVVSVQGMRFGDDGGKRPAKLVSFGPNGEVQWVHDSADEHDVVWSYDVDPMENGNIFVTATVKGHETIFYEFDPRTQETVWKERMDIADTHDADLINGNEEILVANMRNYDEDSGENEDRVFVYNRTTEEIEWEWHFDDHYDPDDLAENYTDDWTHLNDVDKVDDGEYLLSPRNFDQAIVVNRSTDEIDMKLGEDQDYDTLREQHNPDYLESEEGDPTILVADSENNRIAEYERQGERDWSRTWTLRGDLAWPRDADRLANGNTLVSDSSNHRVVEVNPQGEIVWEVYAPWLVYDAARVSQTNESGGPTMADRGATGTAEITGSEATHDSGDDLEPCHEKLENVTGWAEGQSPDEATSDADGSTTEDALGEETDATDGESAEPTDDADAASDVPGFGPVAALAGLLLAVGIGGLRGRQSR
ncbi:arylsulfotransferase family protein [Halorussus salilacus]|uniref:arylsulfotransferase family protein n=1 Tax=Halorussus salilacus TaxID=2953750 RepID=UPI00209F6B38|nr:arylsulfotransferase family protein [Halorussus salilacus]USZ67154.1 arylsulfotransferase family protein [Halorussus salilacus]